MDAPTAQALSLSQHSQGSHVSSEKSLHSVRNEQWSLVSGFSKEKTESWAALGSPRTSRGKLISQSSQGAANSLRNIYSPPSHPIPLTSEGIVVQALNVVADQPSTHFSSYGETSLKKISKRRRKTNGGVDVEHTKSNNEFLRKLQHSLRDLQDDSEEERPEDSTGGGSHSDQVSSLQRGSFAMPMKHSNHSEGDEESSTTSKTTSSTLSDSSNRSTSQRTCATQNEADRGLQSNPYGYEDPDKVIGPAEGQRIPRVARRRGSVTEHTIRAAQKAAAFAAAERAQRMRLSQTHIGSGQKVATMAAAAAKRLQNLQGSSANSLLNRRRRSLERTSHRTQSTRRMSAPENPYGYEDMPMHNLSTNKGNQVSSNSQGYEDPDATARQAPAASLYGYEDPDATNRNLYGYGDSAPQPCPRSRPRPQRRGSVTKYSLRAAKSVAAAAETSKQGIAPSLDFKPVVPTRNSEPIQTMSPKADTQAPAQPMRKSSPWQNQQFQESSTFAARKSALARTSKALGPPAVHAPPAKTESFRTNHSRDMPDGRSDDEDNQSNSPSDDESIDDSVTSITIPLKSADEARDGPMRPPSRHDSLRSFASRGSAHSVRSMDSDGDSLAPDMRSLCSISQHERNNGVASPGSAPPPPQYLPHTPNTSSQAHKLPSSRSGSRKGQSFHYGEEDSIPLTFVETSPLPSPTTQGRSFLSRRPSFQDNMILQPDVSTDLFIGDTVEAMGSKSNH